jgi:pimeloyl-ACP methyl ester carboxylesterase
MPTSISDAPAQACGSGSHTFLLVHGAWNGGWCWAWVAEHLRAMGHRVYTPTCSGLGERSHLLSPDIDLNTFVRDIVNVLVWEDLHDVVLVGHSFGGLVITGVAEQAAERLRQLVYLDAFILPSGVSTFDTLDEENREKLQKGVEKTGGPVPALAPPRPESLGLTDPQHIAFVQGRLTPQPYKSYTTAVDLHHPVGNYLPTTYVQCVEPVFRAVESSANWAREMHGWQLETLATSHCAMITAPEAVASLLDRLAANP